MANRVILEVGSCTIGNEVRGQLSGECDIDTVDSLEEAVARLHHRTAQAILIAGDAAGLSTQGLDDLRAVAPSVARAIIAAPEQAERMAVLAEDHEFRFLSAALPTETLVEEIRRLVFPRVSERIAGAGVRFSGRLGQSTFTGMLLDLSNRGMAIGLASNLPIEDFMAGGTVQDLKLHDAEGRLLFELERALIRHCRSDRAQGKAILRVGLEFGAGSNAWSPPLRTLTEPAAIAASLRKACRVGVPFTLSLPDTEQSWLFERAELEQSDGQLRLRLSGPCPKRLRTYDVVRMLFDLHGQSYVSLTSVVSVDDALMVALPQSLRLHHRRASRRQSTRSDRPYTVRVRSRLTGVDFTRQALNINASGFALAINSNSEVLPPGLLLDEVELVLPEGGPAIRAHGIIRVHSALPVAGDSAVSEGTRCGLEIRDLAPADQARLCDSLLTDYFPNIRVAAEDGFQEIWDFFKVAGFTYQLYGDGSERSRRIAEYAHSRLLKSSRPIASNLLYRQDGAIVGHVAGLRVYSNTWLTTHLAVRQPSPNSPVDRASRALVMAIFDCVENSGAEFCKAIWNRGQKWTNGMFGFAGRTIHDPGLTDMRDFAMLIRSNAQPPPEAPANVEVREASDAELSIVERYFSEHVSYVRIKAEDLRTSSLRMDATDAIYQQHGLFHRRRIRLALLNGQVAGFALLGDSTPAMQLWELDSNILEVYPMPTLDEHQRTAVLKALVHNATVFYTSRDMPSTCAYANESESSAFVELGFQQAAVLRALIFHRTQARGFVGATDGLFRRKKARPSVATTEKATP